MDDLIASQSSSSSIVSFPITITTPPSSDTLKQKLRNLLQNQLPQQWAYAVFWQTFTDDLNGCVSLSWGDGHFLNNKDIHCPFGPETRDDAGWFYVISLTRTFTPGDGSVPGTAFASKTMIWLSGAGRLRVFNCERAKEAHIHGLETLVCIPTSNGVVEMGSYHVIEESWNLAYQVQILFGGSGSFISINLKNLNEGDNNNNASFGAMMLMANKEEMVDTHQQNNNTSDLYLSAKPTLSVNNKTTRNKTSSLREVEVKIIGNDAMIRVQSGNADMQAGKLMDALREMKTQIQHASMSCVNDMMLQDVVARIPDAMDEDELKSVLIWKLDN